MPKALRRAEAAARPGFSRRLFVDGVPAGTDLFRAYLVALIERLPAPPACLRHAFDALIADLRQVLRPDGRASVLWRSVMPGVPDALARLQAQGLRLVVVSNSDGTVEQSLAEAGLRPVHVARRGLGAGRLRETRPADLPPRARAHRRRRPGARCTSATCTMPMSSAREAPGSTRCCWIPYDDWRDLDCPVAHHLTEVADAMAATRA